MKVLERKDNVFCLEQHGRKFFAARMQQGLTAMIVVAHADGTPADAQTRAEAESAVEDWSATQEHDALCATLLASARKAFGLRYRTPVGGWGFAWLQDWLSCP